MPSPREVTPIWCNILSTQAEGHSPSDAWAAWLAKEISDYPIPSKLVGRINLRGETIPAGPLSVSITRLSTDTGALLDQETTESLGRSLNLVVLCSPWASRSPLVDRVVRAYKMSGRSTRLLAAIIAGVPHAPAEQAELECFPVATRFNMSAEGKLLNTPAEPIAADFRTEDGGEGWVDPSAYLDALLEADVDEDDAEALTKAYEAKVQLMKLKVIAGVLGVGLRELTERDVAYQRHLEKQKRNQALLRAGALALLGSLVIWTAYTALRTYENSAAEKQKAAERREVANKQAEAINLARKQEEIERSWGLYVDANKLLAGPRDPAIRAQAYAMLRESAGLGYTSSELKLAQLLFQDKNGTEGEAWLQKAVAKRHPAAINFLGECQLNGDFGYKKNRSEAALNFLAAANLGFHPAMYNLGRMAQENEPGLGGMNEALKWYLKAAENKSIGNALYQLHRIYLNGAPGIPADAAKAGDYLRQAAEAGHVEAQWTLGIQLMKGEGIAKDMSAAGVWFQKVAAQSAVPSLSEQAQIRLATLYRDGMLKVASAEEANVTEALRILMPLAQKGNAEACSELGHTLGRDRGGMLANAAASLFWHRKAAQLGRPVAKFDVAYTLLVNLKENLALHNATRWLNAREGVTADGDPYPNLFFDPIHGYQSAWKEFREAEADLKDFQGNHWARKHLAELYLIDEFHQEDKFDEAFRILTDACKQNDPLAQAMLSAIYTKGHPPQVQANPGKADELRKASLASGRIEPRDLFQSNDKAAKDRISITPEYVKALQQAAGRGADKAQTELGLHFLHFKPYQDTPLPLDFAKAANCLAPGALNSETLALMGLGLTYQQKKALPFRFKLHQKAAQNGDEPLAQLWAGFELEQGIGTEVDLIEAYKWYLIAFSRGQEGSVAAKKRAQGKLSTEQQLEARRRADSYKPTKASSSDAVVAKGGAVAESVASAKVATKVATPPKEKTKPATGTRKDSSPETISPEITGKPQSFLLEEARRIVSDAASTPDELEKAMQYAKAVLAKNNSSTKAMRDARIAAERKGDLEAAHKFTLMAANQKLSYSTDPAANENANLLLSSQFEKGLGTPVDIIEAYKWCQLAKVTPLSSETLARLEKKMSPSQIEEARKRAKAFRRTGP